MGLQRTAVHDLSFKQTGRRPAEAGPALFQFCLRPGRNLLSQHP